MIIERRSFLAGLGALFAAPAIVKASGLMKVSATETIRISGTANWDGFWKYDPTLDLWTQYGQIEQVTLDQYSECIMRPILDRLENQIAQDIFQHDAVLARDFYEGEPWGDAQVGTMLRIRLPNDFVVTDGPSLLKAAAVPDMSVTEVAAIGAAAVLAKNPAVSRRFWSRN